MVSVRCVRMVRMVWVMRMVRVVAVKTSPRASQVPAVGSFNAVIADCNFTSAAAILQANWPWDVLVPHMTRHTANSRRDEIFWIASRQCRLLVGCDCIRRVTMHGSDMYI